MDNLLLVFVPKNFFYDECVIDNKFEFDLYFAHREDVRFYYQHYRDNGGIFAQIINYPYWKLDNEIVGFSKGMEKFKWRKFL